MPTEMQIFNVSDMQTMAQSVAKSRLFGLDEAQAFTLMLLAQSEGIHPIKAVQRYHVIQGRPAMKADAMLADFQKAGGSVEWLTESDDREKCEAVFRHAKHAPQGKTIRFGLNDAKAAGLANKDTWKAYPSAMMRARVVSIGIRMIMPGIVAGLYTPEEIADSAITIDVTPIVPEHHAINHDNHTGHGSGAYAPPETVEAYQSFILATVEEVNQKWLDSITGPHGVVLTGFESADGTIANEWELSGHLLKWARSMDWVKAPQDVRPSQRDKFAAVAWQIHMAEFLEEARRYLRGKWVAARKKAKGAKPAGPRDTPEVLELRQQDEALDSLETTEAGARG
jgi:hypothetical protein